MVGPLPLGPSTVATRAGAELFGCSVAEAIASPPVGGAALVGFGAVVAIGGPAAGGAALVGCGAADAIGGAEVGDAALVGCGAVEAIERPGLGELTCVDAFGASSLEVASVVVVLNPSGFRHVVPSTKYTPIAAPNTTARVEEEDRNV
jgi:hypothetical protein